MPHLTPLSLLALLLLPAAASPQDAPARESAISPGLSARFAALGRSIRMLPAAQRNGLTTTLASTRQELVTGDQSTLLARVPAAERDAVRAFFKGELISIVKVGMPFLRRDFLASQMNLVGSIYKDQGDAEGAAEMDRIAGLLASKENDAEVNNFLDGLLTLLPVVYGAGKEAESFSFHAGTNVGMATVLAVLYGVDDKTMKSQVASSFTTLLSEAKTTAKRPSGELSAGLKTPFVAFSEATITDQSTAFAAIKPVDDAYIGAL